MRIIATALLALGVLALPATQADARNHHYRHWHHRAGPSVMIGPGLLGFYVGPAYPSRYYYPGRYGWDDDDYGWGGWRYHHSHYWGGHGWSRHHGWHGHRWHPHVHFSHR